MNKKTYLFLGIPLILIISVILTVYIKKNNEYIVLEFGMFAGSNWDVANADSYIIIDQAIKRFENEHRNVKIHYNSGILKEDYSEWLSQQALLGKTPDVFMVLTSDFNQFSSVGILKNLENLSKKDDDFDPGVYFTTALNAGKYQEIQYALPYETVPTLMFVNKTLLYEEGIEVPENDWTWDDFKSMVAETSTDQHYGLTMSLIKSEEGTFNVLPFIWQAGADYDSLDSAGAKEAMTMINDFYQNGYMSKELISMTQADMCASLFATGKSSMMVAGSWLQRNIANENPDLNYGVVTFPMYKNAASPIGGGNIMMMKDDNKAAAWKLMSFLSGKENSRKYCEDAGYISPRMDSVADSKLWVEDPVLSVYTEQLKLAKARGPHPKWPEISSALQFAYQDVLAGTASVEAAFDQAAKQVSEIK